MRLTDRVSGSALVVLGLAAAMAGSSLPAVPGQEVGPAAFPMVVGTGLVICGSLIAFGVGRAFEADDEPSGPPRPRWYGLRALLPPGLLILYVLLVEPLGFLPTAALVVGATALALGGSWRLALPLALLAPVGVHLVFARLLRVPLPDGVLPAPW